MNLPQAFYINIQSNMYFKNLIRFKTYHEVLHEIRKEAKNLEPRIKGTQMPSTVWCLLFKLFTLKLTENQLTDMLDNETNPFIRAIAMLYVRLTVEPKEMWDWFEPYLIDEHKIPVYNGGKTMLFGHLVAMLIEEQKFCDLLLPRIPVPIHREMLQKLENAEKLPSAKTETPTRSVQRERNDSRNEPRKDRNRERRRYSRSPPRKYRRSRSPDRERRRDHRDYERRGRDSRDSRDSRRDDRYGRDRRRDSRDGRYDRDDRYSRRERDDRRRERGEDRRYDRERSRSPRNSHEKRERTPSPPRVAPEESKPKKSNANLDKLKELYGSSDSSNSGNTIASSAGYGDSLGDDVVRIGF